MILKKNKPLDLSLIQNGSEVTITSPNADLAQIEIFNSLGNKLQTKTLAKGDSSFKLTLTKGIAYLRIQNHDGHISIKKIAIK